VPAYDDDTTWMLSLSQHRSVTKKGRNRDAEAVRLKALGWSLDEICEHLELGVDTSRAAAAIKRGLANLHRFAVDEHRAMELQSYDELEAECWRQLRMLHVLVDRGTIVHDEHGEALHDDRFVLETVDRILKIKERRARILGLDAPTKAEVLNIDSIDAEIARLEQELAENKAGRVDADATPTDS
jgi:hypothetical protein